MVLLLNSGLRRIGGAFECGDVDALHLHHRVEGPLGASGIGVAEQPCQLARYDLPRQAIAILHPAALFGLWHRRQGVAQAVDLGLCLDRNLERDSLVELEERTAVEAHEGLPHKCEFDCQNVARLARWIVARRAVDSVDMTIRQQ